jgi:hypothetical protein
MLRIGSCTLVFLAAACFGCGSSNSSIGPQDAGAGGAAGSFSAPVGGTSGGAAGSSSAPVGGSAGSSSAPVGGTTGTCLGAQVLANLGKNHVLAGASMDDATAAKAKADLRYLYLSGGIFDGASPCSSCASGCTTNGASCANTAGCGWWGCWQYDQDPPGAYVRNFVSTAKGNSHIPMFTYYQILQAVERNDLRRLLRDRAVPPPVRLPEGRPCLPWARRPSRYCAPVWPAVAG